jgi:hypothetical protein
LKDGAITQVCPLSHLYLASHFLAAIWLVLRIHINTKNCYICI